MCLSKKKIAAVMFMMFITLAASVSLHSTKAQTNNTTLIFAESFNQDLSRWNTFVGPNSTVQIQSVVYNSSPSALLINTSDYLSCIIHDLTPVNASYDVELLLYPANVSFEKYGVLTLLDERIEILTLEINNLTLYVNGINATNLIPEYWNTIKVSINQTAAILYVNGVEVGSYPCGYTEITAIALGSPLDYSKTSRSGEAYFDDLKVYITPISPEEVPSETPNVTNIIFISIGIATVIVAVISALFGYIYYKGKEIKGVKI